MPRAPRVAPAVAEMPEAVYSPLGERLREHVGPIHALHVGDTWRAPFDGGRMEDLAQAAHPGIHRYSATQGLPDLVDALVEKVRLRNRLACERAGLVVTGGATSGLSCAIGALADPGDEVLILAPFWPLIRGIVQGWRARPVEVPFHDRVGSAAEAVAAVAARTSARTVALYVSTPSNPTGRVLPGDWLEALAAFARREDLWLVADEVYEDLIYRGEHVSIGRFAPERTVTAFSFSKSYGMAGYRVGYLAGPPAAVAEVQKLHVHSTYSAPTPSQYAALRALRDGDGWLAESRHLYQHAGDDAAAALGLAPPAGSTFLFLDVADRLDERGMLGFLEDVFEDGVVLAPGASAGSDYAGWVRLCFTAAPPEQVAGAVRLLAKRLGIAAASGSPARA
ncbi:MAG TPA: pyridoxal phosphate-dependent aminotransferase [Myxococcota bacterium]|nr:pyridoxal phosphate-dependent aminotransferase [Myxococcota bacterium]